jgi:hypothetical protein
MTKNPHRKAISQALLSKYPSHGFVIDRVEAHSIGLPVHALEASHETMFLSALTSILGSGESIYGFKKVPPPAAKSASKKSAKKPVATAPTLVAAG